MGALITKQSEPPSYEEFVRYQEDDHEWWHMTVEGMVEYVREQFGVYIDESKVYFDLYGNWCASSGYVSDQKLFCRAFWERLVEASPVMTHVLYEDLTTVNWNSRHNGMIDLDDTSYVGSWYMDTMFEYGIFAGSFVDDLVHAEGRQEQFQDEVKSIIDDIHIEILQALKADDEYRMSHECYEEWLSCQ